MAREVSVGKQSFADMQEHGYFMVDKTSFVRDWWRSGDEVTLVCRPRRFGKTLTLSMVECFFSLDYAGRGEELFGGLDEQSLSDTVTSAIAQIDERRYAAGLEERGIAPDRIHRYGIAFRGKEVLVGA